jgi:hypothetical protein
MNHTLLLQKLIAIERAIGVANNNNLRNMVYEAEGYLLEMQREEVEGLRVQPERETGRRFQFLREVVDCGPKASSF